MNTYRKQNIVYGSYARKSSESEDRQVQSIETQVEQINKIIDENEFAVYGEPIEERQSAFIPGREGLKKLLKWTKEGKVNAWVCYHANRLSRNPIDAGDIIHLMDIGKLNHIRTPSRVYQNNPSDKMLLQFEFMMSKKDSDDKSVFVKDGLEKRYKKGLPTGKAPLGFLNDKTKEKGDRDWLIDQPRLEKVELILNRYLKGNDSIYTIACYARNELHLRTVKRKRQGGAYVTDSGIERLLKNPIYAGFFYSKDSDDLNRTIRELDKELPRVITKEEHHKILSMLCSKSKGKTQSHTAVYKGVIKGSDGAFIGADHKFQLICDCKYKFAYRKKTHCPKCNTTIETLKTPKYLTYIYYYNVKRVKKRLGAKRIEQSKINEFIINYFKENLALCNDMVTWSKTYINHMIQNTKKEQNIIVKSREEEIVIIKSQLDKLKNLYYNDGIGIEDYKLEYKKFQNNLQPLLYDFNPIYDVNDALLEIVDLLSEVQEIIEKGTLNDKKNILNSIGSNLVWDEQNLSLHKPKWLSELEKVRKLMISKYEGFEPRNNVINKDSNLDFERLCPTMLGYWGNVRTCYYRYKRQVEE